MGKYAEATTVPIERTRAEIERLLERYGASAFLYGWDRELNGAVVAFELGGRRVRLRVPMPARDEYRLTPGGRLRAAGAVDQEWEQGKRARWRALALVLKAKLEAIDAGITTMEQEFLSQVVLPSGQTVVEWLGPQLAEVYRTQGLPQLLPGIVAQLPSADDTVDGELV